MLLDNMLLDIVEDLLLVKIEFLIMMEKMLLFAITITKIILITK